MSQLKFLKGGVLVLPLLNTGGSPHFWPCSGASMIDIQNCRTVDSWLLDQMGITWRVELGLAGLGLGLRE